ncbi:MAG: DUF1015 domain-containing protein [Actinomycetaceae bacterium]|nr:DUF1015 domain-containing protein [Actinomycetaceae bacterium]
MSTSSCPTCHTLVSTPEISTTSFLLPSPDVPLGTWSVIACDQFTSTPEYWQAVEGIVGQAPSTLRMIYPEVYLDSEDDTQRTRRVEEINDTMDAYMSRRLLSELPDSAILVERITPTRELRWSLLCVVDLEAYSFAPDAKCAVRPSEMTVPERIPPRAAVRRNAALELSHVQLLFDDPEHTVLETVEAQIDKNTDLLYDTALMQGGGHVRGYRIPGESAAWKALDAGFAALSAPGDGTFHFAVGDGNHSLATAKTHWEALKAQGAEANHPARWSMVELLNIHDPAIPFEPIYRLVYGASAEQLQDFAHKFWADKDAPSEMEIVLVEAGGEHVLRVPREKTLLMEDLQPMLDAFVTEVFPGKPEVLDYIHGDAELRELASVGNCVGILLPDLDRHVLFPYVSANGPMPRKTFSLGEAEDKRYYLEARAIR